MPEWLFENWFILLSAAGIIASQLFTALEVRSDAKAQRTANLLDITSNHREIGKLQIENPSLARIGDPAADLSKQPITEVERIFVNLRIQHACSVYYARNDRLMINQEGLQKDIAAFLTLPIPREVWKQVKPFQNNDFIRFVEESQKLNDVHL